MELSILFLPLIAAIISGFFGKYIGDRNSEIFTSTLVKISEFRSPIYFPKKPEIIEARRGRNKIKISMINL